MGGSWGKLLHREIGIHRETAALRGSTEKAKDGGTREGKTKTGSKQNPGAKYWG